MKFSDLKAYHAYYVMAGIFFLSILFFKDMVFFPLGCCFICLGWVSKLKETGQLKGCQKNGEVSGESTNADTSTEA